MMRVWLASLLLSTAAVLIGASLPLEDAKATVDQLFTYQLDPVDYPAGTIIKVSPDNHSCYIRHAIILHHSHFSVCMYSSVSMCVTRSCYEFIRLISD